MHNQYARFSPRAGGSPHSRASSTPSLDHQQYLFDLLEERQKLDPFTKILPICSRLLDQEIMRTSGAVGTSVFPEQDMIDHGNLLPSGGLRSNGGSLIGWSDFQSERPSSTQPSALGWFGTSGSPSTQIIKKTLRIEVPVDRFPNFNFMGRLLGPRGNSLKRVEQTTGCRVMIRGSGSIKDTAKEEKLRDKPGYEHLNEPLHVLVEAELPANVIDTHLTYARQILEDLLKPPVDENFDVVKKAQLRELAILNGTLREGSPSNAMMTTMDNLGLKRPKTRQ